LWPQLRRFSGPALAIARSLAGCGRLGRAKTSRNDSLRLALLYLQHHSGQLRAHFDRLLWIRRFPGVGWHLLGRIRPFGYIPSVELLREWRGPAFVDPAL
jgi:hypothetical protein